MHNYIKLALQCHCHLIDGGSGEEAVSNKNIDCEDVENVSFENIFEIANIKLTPEENMLYFILL